VTLASRLTNSARIAATLATTTIRIVAWSIGRGFSDWHVEIAGGRTMCGIVLPTTARFSRKQISLETPPRDACLRCWASQVARSLGIPGLL
jgi:hypothetical protein